MFMIPETEKETIAMSSVLAGAFLTGLKLIVGMMTGSLGIISEAAHSALDLVAAFITFLAVRVSDKPADDQHSYGHGKVENLSALIETILLLITCGWIVIEVVKRLFFRQVHVEATVWAFLIMFISIAVDISRSRALRRVAVKYDSQALAADALHFSTDIWSSLAVLCGLGAVKIAGMSPTLAWLHQADSVAALMVAVIVVRVSIQLGRQAVDVLLDSAPTGMVGQIQEAAAAVDGVLDSHKVRVRSSGNKRFIDLHVDVDRNLPFERSHAIAEEVERRVESLTPNANALVHIEPVEDPQEAIADRVRIIALNLQMTIHNVRVHQEKRGLFVDMHLEVDDQMSLKDAHALASRLERDVRRDQPLIAGISTHIESRRTAIQSVEDLTRGREQMVGQIHNLVNATVGGPNCHDVEIRRVNGHAPESEGELLVVTLHCYFDPDLAIGAVHQRSHDVEERIVESFPEVERVTVHAEPRKRGGVTK